MVWRRFVNVLGRLELLSHGAVTSYGGKSSREKPTGGARPQGEGNPPHITYRRAWADCGGDEACQLRVVEDAEAFLAQHQGRARPEVIMEKPDVLEKDIIRVGEGWDARQVANHFRIPITQVMEVRDKKKRCVSTGRVLTTQEDPLVKALKMREQGVSFGEIERRTKVSKSTLHYHARKMRESAD